MDLAILEVRLNAIRICIDRAVGAKAQLLQQISVAGEIIPVPDSIKQKLHKQIDDELKTLFDLVELLKKESLG